MPKIKELRDRKEKVVKKMLNCSLIIAIVIGMCYISPAAAKELLGAGATFPYPLYSAPVDDP